VFRLREHMERLRRSTHFLRIELPFSVDELCQAATDVLAKNRMRAGYLRPIAFVDDGKRGLAALNNRVRVAIAVWPWGAYLGDEGIKRGIRAQVSSTTRMNGRSMLPKGKINGQYVNSILAKRTAQLGGFDEAIMLDDDGYVAEATGENIFIVNKGRLITPPLSQPILEGITRESVMTIARDLGYEVVEQRFAKEGLLEADEIFFTGTAAEVTPVREVDGYVVGNGSRGPITERLQAAYFDAVNGRNGAYRSWLQTYAV
jgi:branched-chain amino acid aminotransferase